MAVTPFLNDGAHLDPTSANALKEILVRQDGNKNAELLLLPRRFGKEKGTYREKGEGKGEGFHQERGVQFVLQLTIA